MRERKKREEGKRTLEWTEIEKRRREAEKKRRHERSKKGETDLERRRHRNTSGKGYSRRKGSSAWTKQIRKAEGSRSTRICMYMFVTSRGGTGGLSSILYSSRHELFKRLPIHK